MLAERAVAARIKQFQRGVNDRFTHVFMGCLGRRPRFDPVVNHIRASAGRGAGQCSNSQADDASGIQEVLVTAQFRTESLQSTPLAITAISGDTLLQKGITDVTGLSHVAPNVSLTSTGAYGGKTVAAFIRGIGAGNYNYNVEPGVAFMSMMSILDRRTARCST